jgi:hypothetical protein
MDLLRFATQQLAAAELHDHTAKLAPKLIHRVLVVGVRPVLGHLAVLKPEHIDPWSVEATCATGTADSNEGNTLSRRRPGSSAAPL